MIKESASAFLWTAIAVAGVGLSLLLAARPSHPTHATANAASRAQSAAHDDALSDSTAAPGEAASPAPRLAVGSIAAASPSGDAADEKNHERELDEAALRDLRSAVELSLSEHFDPVAILASSLTLIGEQTVVDRRSRSLPTGTTCFSVHGASENVRVEFRKSPAALSHDQMALSVRLTMAQPVDQYFLEGALREEPEVELMLVPDESGEMTDLLIHTSVIIAPATLRHGVDLEHGRHVLGLTYRMSIHDSREWAVRAHGLRDGVLDTWETPVTIVGDWQSQMAHVQELNRMLSDMHARTNS